MRQMKSPKSKASRMSPVAVDASGEVENETGNVGACRNTASDDKLTELISERTPLSPKLGANGESKYESGNVGACRYAASSDKLAAMLSERTQAINSIRGLLEREHRQGKSSHHVDQIYFLNRIFSSHFLLHQISTENDLVVELKNEVRILRQDVGWKRQVNDVLEKTVNHLKTKNGDYAQQLRQLSSMVDTLVLSNYERKQRISVLEDDAVAKKIMIDDITLEIHTKKISLEKITDENVDLAERYQRFKIENDGLKVAVKALVASNEENIKQMSMLEEDVAAKKNVIDEMSMDVHKLRTACEEMAAENDALDWHLKLSKAESDRLKAVVQDLESKNTFFASELETLVSPVKEMVEQNDALQAHVVQISAANDDLNEVYNANEEKNAELVDAFNSLPESFNDERSSHEREIEEMKNTMEMEKESHAVIVRELEEDLEDVKTRITAQMAAQKESLEARIANLVKSLDEARVHRRDASCQNEQLLTKIDEVEKSAAQSTEGLMGAMGQLD